MRGKMARARGRLLASTNGDRLQVRLLEQAIREKRVARRRSARAHREAAL